MQRSPCSIDSVPVAASRYNQLDGLLILSKPESMNATVTFQPASARGSVLADLVTCLFLQLACSVGMTVRWNAYDPVAIDGYSSAAVLVSPTTFCAEGAIASTLASAAFTIRSLCSTTPALARKRRSASRLSCAATPSISDSCAVTVPPAATTAAAASSALRAWIMYDAGRSEAPGAILPTAAPNRTVMIAASAGWQSFICMATLSRLLGTEFYEHYRALSSVIKDGIWTINDL